MSTFADLIERHGDDLTYLAADGQQAATNITAEQLPQLITNAITFLHLVSEYGQASELESAQAYIADALTAGPAKQARLLRRAERHLKHLDDTVYDIKLSV
jgi:hypothetical protein